MTKQNITATTKPARRVAFNLAGLDLVAEDPNEANLHCFGDQLLVAAQLAVSIETSEEDACFTSSEASVMYELLRVAREAYSAARDLRLGGVA